MKKTYLLLLCLSVFGLETFAQSNPTLLVSPEQPKPGETIRIEYNWQQGPLKNAPEMEILVLENIDKTVSAKEIQLEHNGGKLVGNIPTSKNTLSIMIGFNAGEIWDNHDGNGYFIDFYDEKGNVRADSKAAKAVMYRTYGSMMDLSTQAATANAWLDEAFTSQPALRAQYLNNYISNWMNIKRGEAGKPKALEMLAELEKTKGVSEKDLMSAVRSYEFLQAMDQSKALKDKIRTDFPKGLFIQQERRQAVNAEPDTLRREALIERYVKDFPPQTEAEKKDIHRLYNGLARMYGEHKNWEKVREIASKIDGASRAELYNSFAWSLAEKDEDLGWARIFAQQATEWAKLEIMAPTSSKAPTITHSNWLKQRRQNFASYADTYAYVLDKTNEPAQAVRWQTQAVEIMEYENDEMNERYTQFLERSKAPDLRYQLEGFIMKGHATAAMKAQFKRLYIAEDKSDAGANTYLSTLENVAADNQKKEIAAKMIERTAPSFTLKNLKGETVSLESLKGKVVVVDFWATWCGPCKASFPGMQEALNKYEKDPNVAFVFIDTWERGAADQKPKMAGDFIASKNYTFNVLMDLEDSVVSSFGVSGIPTKFIIDKNGKIRFKSVGWSGSAETLVAEVSTMIELSKGQP